MKSVFVVWHSHEICDEDEIKIIGVYCTLAEAEAAVRRASSRPGFRETLDGFEISEYSIGKDHWTEGYISWTEAVGDIKK
ncbi:MAG: hypothetical protein ACKV2U_14960 [Bryobacteraceae bacterium]